MAFDGTQALLTGSLITPKSGAHAGELGPWRYLVEQVGIDPAGTPMKVVFAFYGGTWLFVAMGFAMRCSWAWSAMVVAAAGALWFLPFGTLLGVIQLGILLAWRSDVSARGAAFTEHNR